MTYVYDEDVVLAKASHVRRTVETIRSLSSPDNIGVKEWIRDDVTVLNLQRAVEALLDLANHLISANGWELPRDGRHAFAILRSHGLLTEPEQGLAGAAGITSIPTLMAIRDGIVIYAQPGAINEAALNNLIEAVRDVDMDEVRASIQAQSDQTEG